MKRTRMILLAVVAAAVLTLGGCDLLAQWLGLSATVTGSISVDYVTFSSASVTVSNGTNSATASTSSFATSGSTSSATFTLPNVLKGTYTVTLKVDANYNGMDPTSFGTFTVNGVAATAPAWSVSGSSPYTYTITISGLDVQDDTTFDLYFGNYG
jgi:hypothetical protein